MVIVSEHSLYFKLENIKNDESFITFVNKIAHSLRSIPDPSNKILVVKIQDVAYDDSTMIPKLDHKNIDVA